MIASTERVIHPILACRVVLDLRAYVTTQHINTRLPLQVAGLPVAVELSMKDSILRDIGSNEYPLNSSS